MTNPSHVPGPKCSLCGNELEVYEDQRIDDKRVCDPCCGEPPRRKGMMTVQEFLARPVSQLVGPPEHCISCGVPLDDDDK